MAHLIYTLDGNLPSLNIGREAFSEPFRGIIAAGSGYENQEIVDFIYNKDEFETERFSIYSAGLVQESSNLVFFMLKPIFFAETEKAILYLSSSIENINTINASVCFKILYKETNNIYTGCFITVDNYINVLEKLKHQDKSILPKECYEQIILSENFYEKIVDKINKDIILKFFTEYLSEMERYASLNFLKIK